MPGILTADVVAAVLAHFPEDHFKSTSTELQAGFRHIAEEFPWSLRTHLLWEGRRLCLISYY